MPSGRHYAAAAENSASPNKRMQLTKLRTAPVWRAEVPPCAPAGEFGLIPQPQPPAEPQTPAQHSGIRVYVETPWTLLPDLDAARQLRRGLGEAFVIADSRSSVLYH